MHSFRTHADGSITWVPHRRDPAVRAPQEKNCEGEASPKNGEPSPRAQKQLERARKHHERMEKAANFRLRCALRRWIQPIGAPASSGASAAPQTPLRETEVGISGADAACSDGESAIPSRRINEGDTAPPQRDEGALVADHACVGGDEHSLPPELGGRRGDACAAEKRAHASPAAGASSPAVRAPAKARRALAPADFDSHGAAEEGRRAQASMIVCSGTAHEGGATQQPRMLPLCQPETPSNPPGSREGWQGPPGASAPCVGPQQMLAHLRMHEYPAFMNYHAQQGVPEGQAFEMWQVYEHRRMTG